MNKALTALAAAFAAVACAAAATPSPPATPAPLAPVTQAVFQPAHADAEPLACAIEARNTARGVEVSAYVTAAHPFDGEFDFTIAKSGAAGASDIVQGGEISLAPGESDRIGVAEFSLERRARFRANLEIIGADGEVCRDVLRG
ncbi:MAG: hypothetical protein GC189_13895 [Alphaproteobacteria bacterium]|nr:hypothetical protein [Alphaproteobacteria bacterium]